MSTLQAPECQAWTTTDPCFRVLVVDFDTFPQHHRIDTWWLSGVIHPVRKRIGSFSLEFSASRHVLYLKVYIFGTTKVRNPQQQHHPPLLGPAPFDVEHQPYREQHIPEFWKLLLLDCTHLCTSLRRTSLLTGLRSRYDDLMCIKEVFLFSAI